MRKTLKVFVTGTTGIVGSNVAKVAAEEFGAEVVGTIHRTRPSKPLPCTLEPVDITDKKIVLEAIRKHEPDVVIHCAALVDAPFLERHRELGWKIHAEGTENIARACRETGAKLIFVSTDWVFDGTNPPYRETSIPSPVNHYGFLKVVAETSVRLIVEDYAIARIGAVYGVNVANPTEVSEIPCGFGNLANYFLGKLRKGEVITECGSGVSIRANPTLASDTARAMMMIYIKKERGIFHCSGRECISRIDLAKKVAQIFGFDENLVSPVLKDRDDFPEWKNLGLALARETCLDISYTERRLGRKALGVEEGLVQFKKDLGY